MCEQARDSELQSGMKIAYEDILARIQKPGRYIGGEWNQIKKETGPGHVRVALAFPDLYEVGMSYLGQKILYHILNQRPSILAERVFAPWIDFEEELRRENLPLTSLESRIPLNRFDFIGFSLLYELNYSNILTMLDLGGIPLFSSRRTDCDPLVVAGGPAVFNPEPVADFFDLILVGDGEEAFPELCDEYKQLKQKKYSRGEILSRLSRIEGIYVPSLYSFREMDSPPLMVPDKTVGDAPKVIIKRLVRSLESEEYPEELIVPHINVVFDRAVVEAARGCPQNCRFCQARSIYHPVRVRPQENILRITQRILEKTGFEDASLAALSIGDYPQIQDLICRLMSDLDERRVSLSLSSLRPHSLTAEVAENILRVRKTGFTLVPEAATERLRRVINKHLRDDEIYQAVDNAFKHGWRKLKLYFMVGLPTETDEDLQAIVEMVQNIIRRGYRILKKSPQINLSIASFIPKAHTPFQWIAMEQEKALEKKHRYIKSGLKKYPFVRFKDHDLKMSRLEAVFSRGDRRLGRVLYKAWRSGARFDGWNDRFDASLWEAAFQEAGIRVEDYLSSLQLYSPLPWEHIHTGLKREHLIKEYRKALQGEETDPCRADMCRDCEGCSAEFRTPAIRPGSETVSPGIHFYGEKADQVKRYRLFYSKTGRARFLSHMDIGRSLQRTFRRAAIPVEFSRGFHPKMRMSFAPALPLGMAGRNEILDFYSAYNFHDADLVSRLNRYLIPGLAALKLQVPEDMNSGLAGEIQAAEYSLAFNDRFLSACLKKRLRDENPGEEKIRLQARLLIEDYIGKGLPDGISFLGIDHDRNQISIVINLKAPHPPRVQDIAGDIFGLPYPTFSLTRERLILSSEQKSDTA